MLERQQGQLVSCIQQLYQRLQTAGLWEQSHPERSDGIPLTHDILAALGLLEAKDDGSLEFETFNDAVESSQSGDDATPLVFDGNVIVNDRHDSIADQSRSPSLPSEDTTTRSHTSIDLESRSNTSIRTLSPLDTNFHPLTDRSKQTSDMTSTTRPLPPQTGAEYTSSQAQLFATLAATPIHRSVYGSPNTPFQRSASRFSLSLDPRLTRRDYRPNQTMAAPSMQIPFCHEWTRSGITIDSSDFATDFHQLSPLDAGSAGFGPSSLVPETT